MKSLKECGKKWSWSISRYYHGFVWRNQKNKHKRQRSQFKITGLTSEMQTRDFHNMKYECCHFRMMNQLDGYNKSG
jgi:hypothetical protein